jgi:hypothetical protein
MRTISDKCARFSFCKREETQREAARRLARLPGLRSA